MPYAKLRKWHAAEDTGSLSDRSNFSALTTEKGATKHKKYVSFHSAKSSTASSRQDLSSCICTTSEEKRIEAGENNPAVRKVGYVPSSPSECKKKAPGIDYLLVPKPKLTTFQVKMSDSVPMVKKLDEKCAFFPKGLDNRKKKTIGTQTLYRESSAQTLPYLPELDDIEKSKTFEILSLSTLLPGDKPPGLYEVEILERARKRWAFTQALKTNFKRQFKEAREEIFKTKYKSILEAFEWERWIEREEYIQECQMMRLEIVIRMFDKREKEMCNASKTRLEVACKKIEERRQKALQKNEIEYKRAMRKLEAKYSKTESSWRKRSIAFELGSPCSEFYGPQMRHGMHPARRHFYGGRKAFDMRIDELEKKVNTTKLVCPFSKLKEWSKPKQPLREYEQNFCSDANLQQLYETLRGLRSNATKRKLVPKCLKRRQQEHDNISVKTSDIQFKAEEEVQEMAITEKQVTIFEEDIKIDLDKQIYEKDRIKEYQHEQRQEELESILNTYEGTTIGWIMQFLSEEMERLKEQRKLHFFSILAQKERLRREAAEAGLRQKENNLRYIYEELFQLCDVVSSEVSTEYLNNILSTDISHNADWEAVNKVTEIAKQIDKDIENWLNSFKSIQTPLNFDSLRIMLRDFIFPDLNETLRRHEKTLIVKYIIDDVLFPKINQQLDPFDIVTSITGDFIDRLIDNDLYYFSTESESEHQDQQTSQYEAEAIIRKLIRQAVPGRRWRTETECITNENILDIFDEVFATIIAKEDTSTSENSEPTSLHEIISKLQIHTKDDVDYSTRESVPQGDSDLLKVNILKLVKQLNVDKVDKVTRLLETMDVYQGDDDFKDSDSDVLIDSQVYKKSVILSNILNINPTVKSIPRVLNIHEIEDFNKLTELFAKHDRTYLEKERSSILTNIGVSFEPSTKVKPKRAESETDEETKQYAHDLLMDVLHDIISPEKTNEKAEAVLPTKEDDMTKSSKMSVIEIYTHDDKFDENSHSDDIISNDMAHHDEKLSTSVRNKNDKPTLSKASIISRGGHSLNEIPTNDKLKKQLSTAHAQPFTVGEISAVQQLDTLELSQNKEKRAKEKKEDSAANLNQGEVSKTFSDTKDIDVPKQQSTDQHLDILTLSQSKEKTIKEIREDQHLDILTSESKEKTAKELKEKASETNLNQREISKIISNTKVIDVPKQQTTDQHLNILTLTPSKENTLKEVREKASAASLNQTEVPKTISGTKITGVPKQQRTDEHLDILTISQSKEKTVKEVREEASEASLNQTEVPKTKAIVPKKRTTLLIPEITSLAGVEPDGLEANLKGLNSQIRGVDSEHIIEEYLDTDYTNIPRKKEQK